MARTREHESLLGTVDGQHFTNAHIYTSHPSDLAALRIRWEEGGSWRLSLLAEGQNALALPGKAKLFHRAPEGRPFDERHLIVVLAGRSSGLSSLNNWIVQTDDNFRAVSIDLDDVRRAGRDSAEQLQAATKAICHEIRFYASGLDGATLNGIQDDLRASSSAVEVLEILARNWHEVIQGVVFRNFETLEEDTRRGLFGRLRRLYDHPARPLRTLRIFLLGHSLSALDPRLTDPASNLLSVSRIYTVTGLRREEMRMMADRGIGSPLDAADEAKLWAYSGGHPLLVQALLGSVKRQETDLDTAAKQLVAQGLPAFEAWKQDLQGLLAHHGGSLERIVRSLLRRGFYAPGAVHDPYAFQELFIQGWIRPYEPGVDPALPGNGGGPDTWVWRSLCHQHLAAEAFARRRS